MIAASPSTVRMPSLSGAQYAASLHQQLHAPAPRSSLAMWPRPSSTVSHQGTSLCALEAISLERSIAPLPNVVAHWCRALRVECRSTEQGLATLRELAAAPPPAFHQLPAVAAIAHPNSVANTTEPMADRHLALCILSRCSDIVFIRSKTPIVSGISLSRPAVLAYPQPLPECPT